MRPRLRRLVLVLPVAAGCAETVSRVVAVVDASTTDVVAPDVAPRCGSTACACAPGEVCVDGACRGAQPTLRWARTYHADYGAASGVAIDPTGAVVTGGYVQGGADLGGERFAAGASGDGVLVVYEPDGRTRWVRRFPGDAVQVRSVAADRLGVWAGAVFGRVAEVFGESLRSARSPDGFVTHVDLAGSRTATFQVSGDGDEQVATVSSRDDGAQAIVAGYYNGRGRFRDAPLEPNGSPAGFVARARSDGAVAGVATFGAANVTLRGAVALPDDGYLAVGIFANTLDLGVTLRAQGGFDVFVARVSHGDVLWATSYGGAGDDLPDAVAADAQGRCYVVSRSNLGLTVGGAPHDAPGALLVALDASGATRWSRALGASTRAGPHAVAVDAAGNALVGGTFHDAITLDGGATLTSRGGGDLFVAAFDPSGATLWSRAFGGAGDDSLASIAADRCGGFAIVGAFQREVDLGGVTVSTARTDGFVASWTE